jgi:hypothetical protein
MKTLVTHADFDSADGEVKIRIRRLPDNVVFAEWKPNPDDFPQDFITALHKWAEGEQA